MPCTHKFKKTFTRGNYNKEEVIKDNGIYEREFSWDKNTQPFNKVCKTLQYKGRELCTAFSKATKDTCKDVWNYLVDKKYKYNSNNIPGKQTPVAFSEAL